MLNVVVEPLPVYTFFSIVTVPLLEPPVTLIVFVAPVPEAVTRSPVKFNVVAAVDKALPSSCIVSAPPEAAIVTWLALSLVRVILLPAFNCTVESVPVAASKFKSTLLPSCVAFIEYVSQLYLYQI